MSDETPYGRVREVLREKIPASRLHPHEIETAREEMNETETEALERMLEGKDASELLVIVQLEYQGRKRRRVKPSKDQR